MGIKMRKPKRSVGTLKNRLFQRPAIKSQITAVNHPNKFSMFIGVMAISATLDQI